MPWVKLGPAFGGFQAQAGQLGTQLLAAAGDVTTRNVAVTAIRKAREVFDGILRRGQKNPNLERPQVLQKAKTDHTGHYQQHVHISQAKNSTLFRSSWLKYFHQAKNQNLARDLRYTAARNIQSGSAALFGRAVGVGQRRVPLYALLGFSLGAGGVQSSTPSNQNFSFDTVCEYIKTMFQPEKSPQECTHLQQHGHSFGEYEFGELIAKGCNAAVYEARLKCNDQHPALQENDEESIQVISEDAHSEDDSSTSSEGSFDMVTGVDITSFSDESDITIITDSCDNAVCGTQNFSKREASPQLQGDFDLAIKMMFNYDAESQAAAILRSMQNEVVPAKMADGFSQMMEWENGHHPKKKRLKPHPNIVDMQGIFVDDVQPFRNCFIEFPHALPSRINPDGFGRNKTMYLVMKRYNCTLREYLHQYRPTLEESILLLTQLVEAVVHLGDACIAHRDIKSDNILLDTDHVVPQLVLSDFGSCLADYHGNLQVPYFTDDTSKGGNRSLMAPEVVCASPGYRVYLDYSKSDIWACGAVAYEIFGADNPFYRNRTRERLDSSNYREEDLPDLPDEVPEVLKELLKAMLRRDPNQRPHAKAVANVLHLLLWGPVEWTSASTSGGPVPCSVSIMRWLLTLSAGAMCQRAMQRSAFIAAHNTVEMLLKAMFLSRLDLHDTESALEMLWSLSKSN